MLKHDPYDALDAEISGENEYLNTPQQFNTTIDDDEDVIRDLYHEKANDLIRELETEIQELSLMTMKSLKPKQIRPQGILVWVLLAGRGFGKTHAGNCDFIRAAYNSELTEAVFSSRTFSLAWDNMIMGNKSGLLALIPPKFNPQPNRSSGQVVLPVSQYRTKPLTIKIQGFLESESKRGGNTGYFWVDELAAAYGDKESEKARKYIVNSILANREKAVNPVMLFTQTPKPLEVYKYILKLPKVHITTGTTYENKENLSDSFIDIVQQDLEGTALGRQELHGEILWDADFSLWTAQSLDKTRIKRKQYSKMVKAREIIPSYGTVGIDLAVSTNQSSDLTALTVVIKDQNNVAYVVEHRTGSFTPEEWSSLAVALYYKWNLNSVTIEKNQGGNLIEPNIKNLDSSIRVKLVHSKNGKRSRAEPVALCYEQGKIHHVGVHTELESQMITWDSKISVSSPDSIDSLVLAVMDVYNIGTYGRKLRQVGYNETPNYTDVINMQYDQDNDVYHTDRDTNDYYRD